MGNMKRRMASKVRFREAGVCHWWTRWKYCAEDLEFPPGWNSKSTL